MNQWISVKDRLPENDDSVKKHKGTHLEFCTVIAFGRLCEGSDGIVKETGRYVTHKSGMKRIDEMTENEGREFGKWYWADYWDEVTHWMPLPEPPVTK